MKQREITLYEMPNKKCRHHKNGSETVETVICDVFSPVIIGECKRCGKYVIQIGFERKWKLLGIKSIKD